MSEAHIQLSLFALSNIINMPQAMAIYRYANKSRYNFNNVIRLHLIHSLRSPLPLAQPLPYLPRFKPPFIRAMKSLFLTQVTTVMILRYGLQAVFLCILR